jgi:hypothetical protein
MHPAGCLGAVMGPLSQQPHFIQGLASTYSEEHITGVPKSHAVRNETKNEPDAHLAKRNETKPKWAKCSIRETETKHKTTPMPTSRNRNETQNKSDAHLVRNETNETEMGEIDLEAPFRFIRFFSVLSVTLCTVHTWQLLKHLEIVGYFRRKSGEFIDFDAIIRMNRRGCGSLRNVIRALQMCP